MQTTTIKKFTSNRGLTLLVDDSFFSQGSDPIEEEEVRIYESEEENIFFPAFVDEAAAAAYTCSLEIKGNTLLLCTNEGHSLRAEKAYNAGKLVNANIPYTISIEGENYSFYPPL